MLTPPQYGWTWFQLGGSERYHLSYLTDVPFDWLIQAINGLKSRSVFAVHGFCEPGRMICTVSYRCCYVMFEQSEEEPVLEALRQESVGMLDFCRELRSDILDHLDQWACWDESFQDFDYREDKEAVERYRRKNREILRKKADQLDKLIRKYEDEGGIVALF